MPTKLTQAVVNRANDEHEPGTQVYDATVPGLRLVVGKATCSWKFTGRVNGASKRFISVGLGKTRDVPLREARAQAQELKLQLSRGIDPRRPRTAVPTVEEQFERYLAAREHLSDETVQWYRNKLNGALKGLKNTPVTEVDAETCRSLHETTTRKRGRYSANGSARVLRLILNDAARTIDEMPPNPVSRAVVFHREEPRNDAIPPDEMPLMFERLVRIECPIRRAAWTTLLYTGLRSRSCRSARREHLHIGANGDGLLEVPNPKGGKARAFQLPLPRVLTEQLIELMDHTAPLESPFLFPSPTSRSGHIEQLTRLADWPYNPHKFRHGMKTACVAAGVTEEMSRLLLNHASKDVHSGYITREALLPAMRDAIETVAAHITSYRGG